MKSAEETPRMNLPQTYDGVRQYCWKIRTVTSKICEVRGMANSPWEPVS